MANKGFDANINYYEILDVSRDASAEEIDRAYAELKQDVLDRAKKALTNEQKQKISLESDILDEAYDVLSDEELRERYDRATSQLSTYRVIDEEEAEEVATKGRSIWKALGISAAVALIIAALVAAGYWLGKNSNKNNADNKVPTGTEQTSDIDKDNSNDNTNNGSDNGSNNGSEANEDNKDNSNGPEYRQPVNHGDINDSQLVHDRATKLASQFSDAGIINIGTGVPYSAEEIENIILYMNGAYVPTTEQDAYDMYTEYLNFVTGPLNNEVFIYQVNYAGGETSFKERIEQAASNPKTFDLTSAATYGNGTGVEYVQWLQDRYFQLLYTTNEADYNRIYNEVWQSFADIMKGNGFKFYEDKQEYVITEQMLLQKGNIGVANQVTFWLLNFEPFRNTKTQEQYDVIQKFLSDNEEEQHDTVSIDEMFNYINAVCDINALDGIDLATDDNGQSLNTMVNDVPGETWGVRLQSNTKAVALEQYASHHMSK